MRVPFSRVVVKKPPKVMKDTTEHVDYAGVSSQPSNREGTSHICVVLLTYMYIHASLLCVIHMST